MIQFSIYYLVFIFHKFAAIIVAQLYSNASIAHHNIKACIRAKLPQSKHVALALHSVFTGVGIQNWWVQGWQTFLGLFLLSVDVHEQEEQHAITERKYLGGFWQQIIGSHEVGGQGIL
jgi:hypothetical protein